MIASPSLDAHITSIVDFQPILLLIQYGRVHEAHRLLLRLLNKCPNEPVIWLLLAKTSSSNQTALEHFKSCLKIDPANEHARAGIVSTLAAIRKSSHTALSTITALTSQTINNPSPVGSGLQGNAGTSSSQLIVNATSIIETQPQAHPLSRPALSSGTRFFGIANLVNQATENYFTWVIIIYLLFLTAAELITTYWIPHLGLVLHGILLVLLLLHSSLVRVHSQRRFLYSLALAPLIRLLSLAMPLSGNPLSYWYAFIGLPLLFAAYLVYHLSGYSPADVGLTSRKLPYQFLIGALGFPLGYVEYLILKPDPLVQSLSFQDIFLPAIILFIFTGFLEEFIFRGILQCSALHVIGGIGIGYISMLYAVMHIGYRSVLDFVFVLLIGLVFAHIVKRSSSIWGVTIIHGLANISLYMIVPLLTK